MKLTLRRRFALVSAVAVAVAIAAASLVVFVVVRSQLRAEVDRSLRELAAGATVTAIPVPGPAEAADLNRDVVRATDLPPITLPAPDLRRALERAEREGRGEAALALELPEEPAGVPGGYGQLVGEHGRVLPMPGATTALPISAETRAVAAGEREPFLSDVEVGGVHLRVLTEQAGPGQAVQVARSLDEVDAALGRLGLILAAVALAGSVLAALLGRAISRAAAAPVTRLTETAEHVARTRDLGRRIEIAGTDDEIDRLAISFNAMLAELESAVAAQRQLVADASHELRTPLTSLRTNIEVLATPNRIGHSDRERLLQDVVAQLGELGVLVGNLVDLAREEEPAADVELRLDRLIAEVVERNRRRARDQCFRTRLEPCLIRGVPERLDRAIENLLDNAVKWSPTGSTIDISLSRDGRFDVRDRGPGIPPTDAERVFDRFYRAASARGMPGSGLGLAIVRQIAEAHGGSVSTMTPPGGGALVRLALPALPLSANSSLALSSLSSKADVVG